MLSRSALALGLATLFAPSALAQGATQQFCPPSQTIPLSTTNWQLPLTFQRFDPALGILQRVDFAATSQIEVSARFESLDSRPALVTLQRSGQVILRNRADTTTLLTSNPTNTVSETVTAFDGNIDFMGGSGRTYPRILLTEATSSSTTAPSELALFTGPAGNPGTVSLPASGAGTSVASGPGNIVSQINTRAGVSVTVCYVYAPDCNGNGIPDDVDILNGAPDRYGPGTCAADGIPDVCQPEPDCDNDGLPNRCELVGNDCDGNSFPDNCQPDCDGDLIADACEILLGAPDRYGPGTCAPDGIPDSCQPEPDCDLDGLPNRCELVGNDCDGNGFPDNCQPDCNANGIADACEILAGAPDRYGPGTCAPDGVLDVCQPEPDCDLDGLPNRCELVGNDCDANGFPDNCQPDCNANGIADACEILAGAPDRYGPGTCAPDGVLDVCQPEPDCDLDGLPNRCELVGNDCDANGFPDNCQPDCDLNGVPDTCQIQQGGPDRYGPGACAPDGIPDVCQPEPDCDLDGLPNRCELVNNDCDANGFPDNCQPDCDLNGVPDTCQILQGGADRYGPGTCAPDGVPDVCQPEPDCDLDGLPNRCELVNNDCDANGFPDNCQPDCDLNGVPDACQIQQGGPDRYGPGTCAPDGIPDVCQPELDCDQDGLPNRCELTNNDCDANGLPDNCQADCDMDGIADACELILGAPDRYGPGTCAPDGIPDVCQPENDCDQDGLPNRCELANNDCDGNGFPDNCQPDCDGDGIADACEIQQGTNLDRYGPGTCAPDGIPDVCQPEPDCDQDGLPNRCELAGNDCDANGFPDNCQPDCDLDGVADVCEILQGAFDRYGPGTCAPDGIPDICQPELDCDRSGLPDRCELASNDCDANGVPDNCQLDCDGDGMADACEILNGSPDRYGPGTCAPDGVPDNCQPQPDCDHDGMPDRCELAGNDCDANGFPDNCQPDCDGDGIADKCEILQGALDRYGPGKCVPDGIPDSCQPDQDCDQDGIPNRCELAGNDCDANHFPDNCQPDCDDDGLADVCEILQGAPDRYGLPCTCVPDGIPDSCQPKPDCDGDGIPDFCEIVGGAPDANHDGVPDECQLDCCIDGRPAAITWRYTGQPCSVMNHMMAAGKVTCSGDSLFAPTVRIRASDDASPTASGAAVYFDGTVNLNGDFIQSAAAGGDDTVPTNTFFHIFAPGPGGALLQTIAIHTSCSQPMFEGNVFAALTLVDCGEDDTSGPDCCVDGRPEAISWQYTGQPCSVMNHQMAAGKVTCSGDSLFTPTVRIRASDDASPTASGAAVYFDGTVNLNDVFIQSAAAGGDSTVPTNTYFHIFAPGVGGALLQTISVHTSCSQPLHEGNVFAALTLVNCGDDGPTLPTCCEDGRPRALTMRYTGQDCSASNHQMAAGKVTCSGDPALAGTVRIRASDDASPTASGAAVYFDGTVLLGADWTATAAAGGDDRFPTNTYFHIFAPGAGGALLQTIGVHTSCSQPLFEGNQFGSLLLVDCSNDTGPTLPTCCDDGRPRQLGLRYTGQSCAASNHQMEAGKVTCTGDPALAGTVRVRVSDNSSPTGSGAAVYFDGTVLLGADFTANAAAGGDDRFPTDSYVHVFSSPGNALLQTIKFHTSCSQPLFEGNQFGSILLVSCSTEIIVPPGNCCANGKPRQLSMQYTGESCAATSHTMDDGKVTCSGDPLLAANVRIRVSDKSNPLDGGAKVWFAGDVPLNGFFYPDAANAGATKLANDTFIHIYAAGAGGALLQSIKFHTSCSQPLFVGNQFGAALLVGCLSENDAAASAKFCAGETTNCPCANQVPGAGCRNGRGLGAELKTLGSKSIFTDDLQLVASNLPLGGPGRAFMGAANGPAVFLENGTRCVQAPAGGSVYRFPIRFANASGVLKEGPGLSAWATAHLPQPGGAIQPGLTRYFQVWYRDANGPCDFRSNLTNAVAVTFAP